MIQAGAQASVPASSTRRPTPARRRQHRDRPRPHPSLELLVPAPNHVLPVSIVPEAPTATPPAGLSGEPDLLSELVFSPPLDPDHLLLRVTSESLADYARLLSDGFDLDDLAVRDPRLLPQDLQVIRRCLDAGLHHPVDPDELPDELLVVTAPPLVEILELNRGILRQWLDRQPVAT